LRLLFGLFALQNGRIDVFEYRRLLAAIQLVFARALERLERLARRWRRAGDLSKFFDRVNRPRLLNRLAQRVPDARTPEARAPHAQAKVEMPDGTRLST